MLSSLALAGCVVWGFVFLSLSESQSHLPCVRGCCFATCTSRPRGEGACDETHVTAATCQRAQGQSGSLGLVQGKNGSQERTKLGLVWTLTHAGRAPYMSFMATVSGWGPAGWPARPLGWSPSQTSRGSPAVRATLCPVLDLTTSLPLTASALVLWPCPG